jgi:hypothetical protein
MVELLGAFAGSEDAEAEPTFGERIGVLLDEVVRLSGSEPARVAALLHPPRHTLLESLVDAAIDSGEVHATDRDVVIDTLVATIAGLMQVGSVAPAAQAEAVEGFKRLFCGITWDMQLQNPRSDGTGER